MVPVSFNVCGPATKPASTIIAGQFDFSLSPWRMVAFHVIRVRREQLQVFYSIVEAVAVFVMYNFIRAQKSPKVLTHDIPVFGNAAAIYSDKLIAALDPTVACRGPLGATTRIPVAIPPEIMAPAPTTRGHFPRAILNLTDSRGHANNLTTVVSRDKLEPVDVCAGELNDEPGRLKA